MTLRPLPSLIALLALAAPAAFAQPGTARVADAAQAPATFQVKFETSAGPFVVEVTRDLAPNGADRFYELVKKGYYDDMRVFRVVEGFVAQFGMAGDPQTNAAWREAKIPDDAVKASNKRGTVTFATSGKNSRTTQLFVNLGDNARLDGMGFAVFGQVVEGMDVVDKFYAAYGERPDQGQINRQGNAYLDAQFPKLTKIETARVVSENGRPVEGATR